MLESFLEKGRLLYNKNGNVYLFKFNNKQYSTNKNRKMEYRLKHNGWEILDRISWWNRLKLIFFSRNTYKKLKRRKEDKITKTYDKKGN